MHGPTGAVTDDDVEAPPIEAFHATHNPEDCPDYINLPKGIEAIELAKDAGCADYANLDAIVKVSEEYLERNAIMALTSEALAAEMDKRISLGSTGSVSPEKDVVEAFSLNNPFAHISLWENEGDEPSEAGGSGGDSGGGADLRGSMASRLDAAAETDELGVNADLDELWGVSKSSDPHAPI
jgi:hypothetical protein